MQNLIRDIRIYESDIENIDHNSSPNELGRIFKIDFPHDTYIHRYRVFIHRLILVLREHGFELPGYNHLYINLTPLLPFGQIQLAKRSLDTYHPWFRYVDVGLNPISFNQLSESEKLEQLFDIIENALLYVIDAGNYRQLINESIAAVLTQGENFESVYKFKETDAQVAKIIVRLLNNGRYAVRIQVQTNDGQTRFTHSLETQYDHYDLVQQFGTIILNKNSVVIKPRQNAFSEHYGHKPLKFLL